MSDIALSRENERLKIYNENYRNQIKNLEEAHEKEIQELKSEYEKKIEELENIIKKQKSIINLQTRKREITDEEVQEIKDLRASGLSYSKIAKKTEWSTFTISRVLNGAYDK